MQNDVKSNRVVCWFSCGATSFVATQLAIKKYGTVEIVYCDTGSEHIDNERFLKDCEKLFGQKITVLKNNKYESTWDLWEKTKYLVGPGHALCTYELKIKLRKQFLQENDIQIFGFDFDEIPRAMRFIDNNPDAKIECPLIDEKITKQKAFDLLVETGIQPPEMYVLGFNNNNCIGCVKGGMGYWQHVRKHFPDIFNKMAELEVKLGVTILKDRQNNQNVRLYLKDLEQGRGRPIEPLKCGFSCQLSFDDASLLETPDRNQDK